MAPDTVPAAWNGPFEGDRGPGLPSVKAGDVLEVSPDLLESGHWTAVPDVTPASTATNGIVAAPALSAPPVRPTPPDAGSAA